MFFHDKFLQKKKEDFLGIHDKVFKNLEYLLINHLQNMKLLLLYTYVQTLKKIKTETCMQLEKVHLQAAQEAAVQPVFRSFSQSHKSGFKADTSFPGMKHFRFSNLPVYAHSFTFL